MNWHPSSLQGFPDLRVAVQITQTSGHPGAWRDETPWSSEQNIRHPFPTVFGRSDIPLGTEGTPPSVPSQVQMRHQTVPSLARIGHAISGASLTSLWCNRISSLVEIPLGFIPMENAFSGPVGSLDERSTSPHHQRPPGVTTDSLPSICTCSAKGKTCQVTAKAHVSSTGRDRCGTGVQQAGASERLTSLQGPPGSTTDSLHWICTCSGRPCVPSHRESARSFNIAAQA